MKRRSIISIVAVVLLVALCATTALAASARPNFTWLQGTSSTWTSSEFTTSGQVEFEGVATSPNSGQFTVVLQKKNILGIWSDTSNAYTVSQHSNWTYNTSTGQNVQGQYFKLIWPSQGSSSLRIVLKNPTNPQATVFTQVRY